ncbi:tlde1 domain-containing protein [Paraburkholderia youngii]|uniref:tlde1 domain-containing protein n=2 Tax=Paraburkholderia youngii TaxID=2782701 RepID=UPI0028149F37|nr:tlde1 domain-containing protein [Paraburkholderia youngii]
MGPHRCVCATITTFDIRPSANAVSSVTRSDTEVFNMTWTYNQTSGTLSRDGSLVARGYSGHGAGKNNPVMQAVRSVGPIPEGSYTIGTPRHSHHVGAFAMPLTPDPGTETFGRNAFSMHGDSKSHPGSASNGCIALFRTAPSASESG